MINSKKQLLSFLIATFVLTLLLTLSHNEIANALAQAVPAMVAITLVLLTKQKRLELTKIGILRLGNIKWYVAAVILPFTAIALAYLAADLLGFVQFTRWQSIVKTSQSLEWFFSFFYKYLIYTFLWPLLWAVGEELGWRGFLQPRLVASFGLNKGILITAVIWATWHYIFIFYGGYYEGGNIIINTLLLTTTIVFMAFTIGYIRHFSQSVWPCVVFHSASNAAWQMWAYQYKVINENYIYIAGEAGVANIIFWAACFYFLIKDKSSKVIYK